MRGGSQDMWSKSANFNRTISSVVVRFWNCLHKIYGNTSLDPIIEVLKLLAATSTLRSMSFNGYGPKPCRAKYRTISKHSQSGLLITLILSKFAAWCFIFDKMFGAFSSAFLVSVSGVFHCGNIPFTSICFNWFQKRESCHLAAGIVKASWWGLIDGLPCPHMYTDQKDISTLGLYLLFF